MKPSFFRKSYRLCTWFSKKTVLLHKNFAIPLKFYLIFLWFIGDWKSRTPLNWYNKFSNYILAYYIISQLLSVTKYHTSLLYNVVKIFLIYQKSYIYHNPVAFKSFIRNKQRSFLCFTYFSVYKLVKTWMTISLHGLTPLTSLRWFLT